MHSRQRRHQFGANEPRQLTIQFHPDAVTEMSEAALFYEERQPGLGERLLHAIEEALDAVKTHPALCRADKRGRRKYRIRRFPYLLIYKATPQMIVILAIAHTSRKPGYWKGRDG